MSYCRWSSDGAQCDVYAYKSVHGGYRAHVAKRRRPRRLCDHDITTPSAYIRSAKQQAEEMKDPTNQPVPIGKPYDGHNFSVATLQDLENVLRDLHLMGYKIPHNVLERIRKEIIDEEM